MYFELHWLRGVIGLLSSFNPRNDKKYHQTHTHLSDKAGEEAAAVEAKNLSALFGWLSDRFVFPTFALNKREKNNKSCNSEK